MKITSTKSAFLHLISQKGFAKKSGENKATVANWIRRAEAGGIGEDKMQEVLIKHGAKIKSEKVWEMGNV